ncbi:MAG TPA: 2Fe-2S iron-sulfur cluster-binding protein [Polyangium sp.]|nr:2Fe-2S iron-sulfur cluster-binding protein [Polyangium sp.]
MFRRTRAFRDPVTIHLDGSPVRAERGEPLAASLLAEDKIILARSPKLHRPRSASCFHGGCDGCLMRVDGTPNVMTCLHATRGDEEIEAQNVVGSRQADLLRVTDWFFPKGIDHHHFMAGVPALGSIMQSFARKIAGLGRMPSEIEAPRPARLLEADVVVVGAGLAGLVVAQKLGAAGARVVVVDDGLSLGGSLLALPDHAPLLASIRPSGDLVFSRATAAGVYLGELLVAAEEGAVVVRAPAKVFATGTHDGVSAFPGNDLPGVFSARALCLLHTYGVEPDGPVVVAGAGFWADELARRLGDRVLRCEASAVAGVEGTGQVKRVLLREGAENERRVDTEILALALPGAPAFELAAQAGAEVRFDPARGYAVACDADGAAGEGIWAVGECTGMDFDPDVITAAAERCAAAISRR